MSSPTPERPSNPSLALVPGESLTFVHALVLVFIVNLAVRLLPFRRVAARLVRGRLRPGAPCAPDRIGAIVARAAVWCWPAPSCLTRSLVVCRLLVRRGIDAQLVLGVDASNGGFAAHAWVEHDGLTIHDDAAAAGRFRSVCRIDHRGVVTAVSP